MKSGLRTAEMPLTSELALAGFFISNSIKDLKEKACIVFILCYCFM
jgi:hypothetical protein